MTQKALIPTILTLTLLSACSGGGSNPPAGGGSNAGAQGAGGGAAAGAGDAVDMSKAGTVSGKITFEGTPPDRTKIQITEAVCKPMHPEDKPLLAEDVVVGAGGGLKNVVVKIVKGLEGKKFAASAAGATVDQTGCQYVPHVVAMMPGDITVQNSDDTLHNVHSQSQVNKAFNKGQSGKGKKDSFPLKRPETVKLTCDVHGWMNAYVVVHDNPCIAVSGDDGSFSFKAPAGKYTVEAWHEKLGTKTAEITVADNGTVTQDFKFASK